MPSTTLSFRDRVGSTLRRDAVEVLQVNVGKLCNQTCSHCHVNAGPNRTEQMPAEMADAVLRLLDRFPDVHTVDVTGGAPEMSPQFKKIARAAHERGLKVIDRCNLTILSEPGHEDLTEFLADHGVNVVASLPCYLEENVDGQRGDGVFARSIEGLRRLNSFGYGTGGSLVLDLVYNPTGPSLPPDQAAIERDYKDQLGERYGITFDGLLTITNMVISRYESFLKRTGQLEAYQTLLEESFNPATIPQLMCRNTLSISWDGSVYDCDFNQMLDLRIGDGTPLTVETVTPDALAALPIIVGRHCFGCTAGAGSSCSGSLGAADA